MDIEVRHVDELTAAGVAGTAVAQAPDVAVVIDVVRAFTVAPWCLARGAARLLIAASVPGAVEARRTRFPEALLLKDGETDPRFALPNAPGRIAREDLTGRVVIQRTGNGTRGAYAVTGVPLVLCAGFVTAGATARTLIERAPDRVLLVPTEGDEDVALADYLGAVVRAAPAGELVDPRPYLERARRSPAAQECRERGPDPAWPGFDVDDLDRCLALDTFDRTLRAAPDGDLLALTWVG